MNKFNKVLIVILILISGCKTKQFNEEKMSQRIDSFNMNIFSNQGNKIFTIKSPFSIYDKAKNIIKLESTTIYSFNNNEAEYVITSDNSKLSNSNKLIELNGNVFVQKVLQKDDKLFANRFTWNINKSEYLLTGNVKFENEAISLSSNKAILNKGDNIIEFFNPVKYIIKNNNEKEKYVINSENAYYDILTKSVSFTSVEDRVRSKFYF